MGSEAALVLLKLVGIRSLDQLIPVRSRDDAPIRWVPAREWYRQRTYSRTAFACIGFAQSQVVTMRQQIQELAACQKP